MAREQFSKEDLAFLSPEERAGLLDETPDAAEADHNAKQAAIKGGGRADPPPDENVDALAADKVAAEGVDNPTDTDTKVTDDGAKAADPKAAKAADGDAEKVVDDKAAADAAAEADELDRTARLTAPADDFTKQRAELRAEKSALRKQFTDGDLSQDDFDTKMDAIEDKRDAITRAEARAEVAGDYNDQMAATSWKDAQAQFHARTNNQFNDDTKPGIRAALNEHIERIDRETKKSLSGSALLAKAEAAVRAEFGMPAAPATKGNPRPAPKTEAQVQQEASERVPKTLATVPNAQDDDDNGGDRFAHLDKLGGMEYEAAYARLSPADQNEYLSNR